MTGIALLDGGLGQEIHKRSRNATHPLWSLKVMLDDPATVQAVHLDFIEAGARVVTLNTYTATPTRMQRHGLGDRLEEAHRLAIELARAAIKAADRPVGAIQVAGCVPPLVASYVAEASMGYAASLAEYRRVVALQKDHVDLFLIETMSNVAEAEAALDAVKETGKPVLVGLTLADDTSCTLRSGEPLNDAVSVLSPKHPDGFLLNCSIPEAITAAMPVLAGCGLPFGGYANGFTSVAALRPGGVVDALTAREDLDPEAYSDHALGWVENGATVVGGCCEVGPAHVERLAQRLAAAGHSVTNLEALKG